MPEEVVFIEYARFDIADLGMSALQVSGISLPISQEYLFNRLSSKLKYNTMMRKKSISNSAGIFRII